MWEPVDWTPFDVAGVDAYRDAGNASRFRLELRQHLRRGKPLAVTEFGCCGYAGAADRGGLGWAILDTSAEPPVLDSDYVRDEHEQVTYLRELTEIFEAEGVDLAFWFTFAGYGLVPGPGPRRDLDLASYGLVKMTPAARAPATRVSAGNPSSRSGRWPRRADAAQRAGNWGPVHYSLRYPGPPPRYPLGKRGHPMLRDAAAVTRVWTARRVAAALDAGPTGAGPVGCPAQPPWPAAWLTACACPRWTALIVLATSSVDNQLLPLLAVPPAW
jgi:hypothetical protein